MLHNCYVLARGFHPERSKRPVLTKGEEISKIKEQKNGEGKTMN